MATSTWLAHPKLGYEAVAENLRKVIQGERSRIKKLDKAPDEAWDTYDRLPAPSLIGLRRTVGELRLITNAVPATRWQQAVRLRHLMDYYNAERLELNSPGVSLVTEMAKMLTEDSLPSVAYISPINYEVVDKFLGGTAREHIGRNADIVAESFCKAAPDLGIIVNAVFACPGEEFSDPVHLKEAGRRRLAASIADAVRPRLLAAAALPK
jgi:hypothetical protein